MNAPVETTLEDYQQLYEYAQHYLWLKSWARHTRGTAWQLGVTLFTTTPDFDAAVAEARAADTQTTRKEAR